LNCAAASRPKLSSNKTHKESLEDDLVELGVSSSGEEAVELDQHVEVQVIGLGGRSPALAVFFVADIDTHFAVFFRSPGKLLCKFDLRL